MPKPSLKEAILEAGLRAMFRTDYATYLTVFALIATGARLFTVGLATLSWAAWSAGLLTMLAATLLDAHHRRALQRTH